VARELTNLGERPRIDDGGVSWEGDARSLMRANLWLRTASRVLVRVAQFRATEFYELEKRAKKIEWDRFLRPDMAPDFRVTARKSKLYHSGAIAERLRTAARPRHAMSRPPGARNAGGKGSPQLFVIRVVNDDFEVSVDSSGALLHMRGYRQAVGKAPLRETLAAALLLGSDWGGDVPLLDPLCGSGTIPIEAALIARRLAPGMGRSFAFQRWPGHDAAMWNDVLVDAKAGALAGSLVVIAGSDRDAGAIASATANAERAGVGGDVTFSVASISAIAPPDYTGLIATNPPYGKRVGKAPNVRNLYAQLGNVVRDCCPGWQLALYAADERLATQIGLPLRMLFRTTNGGIKIAALAGTVR
jgi:putative N6-adenine-specific DNA methylase